MTRGWGDWEVVAVREGDGALMVRTGTDEAGREVGFIYREGCPIVHGQISLGGMLRMSNGTVWLSVPGASSPEPDPAPRKPRWPTRNRRRRGL